MKKKKQYSRFDRLYNLSIRLFFLCVIVFILTTLLNFGMNATITKVTRLALYGIWGFGAWCILLYVFSLFFKP